MEDVAFQDWPGQPVDLNSGNNPWMPAYGYQTPSTLLEKEDFIGNPDAEYFFHNTTNQYMYLETIQEETSDDLQSESDVESRNSPVGWLASDSESGSVICREQIDEVDCDSDRELACPAKRRKQDFLTVPDQHEDVEESSLSRSSSLLQFETLEKQCQQENETPSIYSQLSLDSLELSQSNQKGFDGDDNLDCDGGFFSGFGNDEIISKQNTSRDSLLYNVSTRFSGSDSSDSDTTFEGSRSCDNLKTWRSFDSLPLAQSVCAGGKKFSSENLSEDSGYGDQLITTLSSNSKGSNLFNNLSTSAGSLMEGTKRNIKDSMAKSFEDRDIKKKNSYVGFSAYDCDVYQNFNTNFGTSYHDLSIFDRYDPFNEPLSKSSPLTDVFLRKKQARQLLTANTVSYPHAVNLNVNLNLDQESKYSNFNDSVSHSASVPNLLESEHPVDIQNAVTNVYSVPKDLNFISEFNSANSSSVAEKNWNLADINFNFDETSGNLVHKTVSSDSLTLKKLNTTLSDGENIISVCESITKFSFDTVQSSPEDLQRSLSPEPFTSLESEENDVLDSDFDSDTSSDSTMASYKREGSYTKAMDNRVDLSDDENSLLYKKRLPKSPIIEFDRRVLKAISEQSIQSLMSSTSSLHGSQNLHGSRNGLEKLSEKLDFTSSTPKKRQDNSVTVSTPDLNRYELVKREKTLYDEERRQSMHEVALGNGLEEQRSNNILLDTYSDFNEVRSNLYHDNRDMDGLNVKRKGSIIKSSTSTSGMSDIDEKTLTHSVRSLGGSSKGVHFSPVVAEVDWHDDRTSTTPERESSCSLNSSSPEPIRASPNQKLVKPKARYRTHHRRSVSQPDLSDNENYTEARFKQEFIDSLNNLRNHQEGMSKSQPDVSRLRTRRGSQMIKKEKDGFTIKAYVDRDGVQYKHSHLDINSLSQNSLNEESVNKPAAVANKSQPISGGASTQHRNNFTSKFPSHQLPASQTTPASYVEDNRQSTSVGIKQSNVKQSNVKHSNVVFGKQSKIAMAEGEGITTGGSRTSIKQKSKSGLGGFLQRLASFRLGARKGQEEKEKLKKNGHGNGTSPVNATAASSSQIKPPSASKIENTVETKPDYIYIPLKGPLPSDNNNSAPVCSKPPLPRQPPPRVVHACVKKVLAQSGVGLDDRRRRRTIDSAGVGVERNKDGVARYPTRHGNVSMEGPMGLIETDLDTEVTVITNGANAKARSLLDLGAEGPRLQVPQTAEGQQNHPGRPHKSMEFLLDKQNLKCVEPPENELRKTDRIMSEHELRVQRSLQKLTVPEWYKQAQVPTQGFLLKKHPSREARWTGTSSKTTSLSSLGSETQSPLVLSPTPNSQPFVRWSTSKLNSTASSPCQSTRSSFNQGRQPNGSISPSSVRSSFSYRQPYLGWRSQERLNRPRTPAERLASSLLAEAEQIPNSVQHESPEIQTSIKEVTSAIVHYVSGLKPNSEERNLDQDSNSQRSSSISPRGSQACWLESSFVGTKPLDSPETPVTCSESPVPPYGMRMELQNHSSNGESLRA